jgi:hypothetical protein
MIRKITIDQLRTGMFVHDLDCGWLDQRFLWNAFPLSSDATLRQIRELGVQALYIDTEKGLDVASAQTQQAVEQELDDELTAIAKSSTEASSSLACGKSSPRRLGIRTLATSLVEGLMDDVRLGRSLDFEQANPVVGQMADSIFRNQDALLGLQRIRRLDHYTFEHSVNVSVLMLAFSRSLNLELRLIRELGLGALLHDIGKTMVPSEILNKPGSLNDQELDLMRSFTRLMASKLLSGTHRVSARRPRCRRSTSRTHRWNGISISAFPGLLFRCTGKWPRSSTSTTPLPQTASITAASNRARHSESSWNGATTTLTPNWSTNSSAALASIRSEHWYDSPATAIAVVIESSPDELLKPVIRVCFDPRRKRVLPFEDLDLSDPLVGNDERILHAEPARNVPIDIKDVMGVVA